MYSTTVQECGTGEDWDCMTEFAYATLNVLCVGLHHFQCSASPFLHRCTGTFQSPCKGKAIPVQAWIDPDGSRRLWLPDFMTVST